MLMLGGATSLSCAARRSEELLDGGGDAPADYVVARGENIFTDSTLTDWVSYVQEVAVVTITAERPLEGDGSSNYIGRSVDVMVRNIVWQPAAGLSAPPEFQMTVAGWIRRRDGALTPVRTLDAPRLEKGGSYVIPLVPYSPGSRWGPFTGGSVFELMGDTIAHEDVLRSGNSAVAQALARLSLAEIAESLSRTAPDPDVVRFWNLPPVDRLRAVQAERRSRG